MVKALCVLSFYFCLVSNCFAQKSQTKIHGTVQIDDNTSMKETEVSLLEWMMFIVNNDFDQSLFPNDACISSSTKLLFEDLKKGKDFEYLKIGNNDKVTIKSFGEKGVEVTKDFARLSEADSNFFSIKLPVTGITFEQAQRFCKWKEDIVNKYRDAKITISLPPVDIYKRVITNIDSLTKNKKCYILNCRTAKCKTDEKSKKSKQMSTQGVGLEDVTSYFPTELGLYNLEGNAAEMTDSYGIAMGGSFRQTARESYNDKRQLYNKAEDWLGFRYIVTAK